LLGGLGLLVRRQDDPGRLLAVPERRIEDRDPAGHSFLLLRLRAGDAPVLGSRSACAARRRVVADSPLAGGNGEEKDGERPTHDPSPAGYDGYGCRQRSHESGQFAGSSRDCQERIGRVTSFLTALACALTLLARWRAPISSRFSFLRRASLCAS